MKINIYVKKKIKKYRRIFYKLIRKILGYIISLWIRKVHNLRGLPKRGPLIIVANHGSYLDSILISALYKEKYIVIVGKEKVMQHPLMRYMRRFNLIVFADSSNGEIAFFRELLRKLKQRHIVVIFPEGTRSKTGKLLLPKPGFVRLALSSKAPILPLGIKGSYNILPPHKFFPNFTRCEIFVGQKVYINKEDPLLSSILTDTKSLTDREINKISFEIMNYVARMTGLEWEKV